MLKLRYKFKNLIMDKKERDVIRNAYMMEDYFLR